MTSGLAIMGVRDRSFFIGVNKGMNEAVLYVSPNLKQIQALTDGRNLTLSFPEKPEIKYTLRRPSLAPALVQYTMSYMGASIAVDACTGEINKWLDDCLEEEGLTFFTTSQRHSHTNKNYRHSVYVFATESSVESLNDHLH
ncbi:uncharacterized protein LOC131942496 [Physella acuta]|uniref:uncharacterized protein LOC131942496 n=1 Tax=Physella acuta TaxID=109671 RepID=UPI0027DC2F4A|nr:uncharacterized protein LOC131942496 [Physella acuta]